MHHEVRPGKVLTRLVFYGYPFFYGRYYLLSLVCKDNYTSLISLFFFLMKQEGHAPYFSLPVISGIDAVSDIHGL